MKKMRPRFENVHFEIVQYAGGGIRVRLTKEGRPKVDGQDIVGETHCIVLREAKTVYRHIRVDIDVSVDPDGASKALDVARTVTTRRYHRFTIIDD